MVNITFKKIAKLLKDIKLTLAKIEKISLIKFKFRGAPAHAKMAKNQKTINTGSLKLLPLFKTRLREWLRK